MSRKGKTVNGREHWGTRLGLVLAMAGNAVGLGNFLRFPVQAASYGGGAFMIPYFIALILLGIPLMWVEWAMGRYGGVRGHGTTPGIFKLLWPGRLSKYLGILGIALPLLVVIYYVYIESWTLAYSFFSATGTYSGGDTEQFLESFLWGGGHAKAYLFFCVTIALNFFVVYRGISRGIEILAKIAMPTLFLFAIILVIRVVTLGAPDPTRPERHVLSGLAFLWNPDLKELANWGVWLAATGQVFFTLSIGFGVIQTYASYLREKDDVALSGLSTASTNEFAEVVLGGSLAIPLAFAFFGPIATRQIAESGAFNLGFVSLPLIFDRLPIGTLFGTLWFGLLFFAGITSSVALTQPAIAFLEDEFGWPRSKATIGVWSFIFLAVQPVILGRGFLDELDFWAGTAGVVLFATIEIILFSWVFGMKKGWAEITRGADIKVPRIFYYVLKYVTPVYLIGLLVAWISQQGKDVITLAGTPPEQLVWKWGARALILAVLVALVVLVASSKRLKGAE